MVTNVVENIKKLIADEIKRYKRSANEYAAEEQVWAAKNDMYKAIVFGRLRDERRAQVRVLEGLLGRIKHLEGEGL